VIQTGRAGSERVRTGVDTAEESFALPSNAARKSASRCIRTSVQLELVRIIMKAPTIVATNEEQTESIRNRHQAAVQRQTVEVHLVAHSDVDIVIRLDKSNPLH